ncbi:MAG: phage tail tape measure protein, partial [Spartobacteria bacterium]|nr:phage tail tape measure protein [Spartobacteria bacterium]
MVYRISSRTGLQQKLTPQDKTMANKVLEILIKLAKSGTGAADAARDIGAIDTSSGRAEKGLRDTEQAAKKTGTAFKELGSKIKSMGSSFLNTFKSLKIEALAFAGILAGTVREAVMNNINIARAWTMSSTMGFKEMRTEVRNLSMELGVAKDKISSGLYQALSAGVPEDNVFKFLETASKVAVADGSDVAVAVDGITTVLNAFKIEADNTGKVADLMFQTVSNGKTTFSDLASNLSTVAPLAASTGIGIEQILAATATLTKQGTPTAQAMTQIRESIRALNNNLGDGWSKTRTFQEAVQELARKANGSQTELSKIVGSVEALVGVLGLTGENATAAKEDLEDLEKASGALDTAYEKVDKFRHWSKLWETSRAAISRVGEV